MRSNGKNTEILASLPLEEELIRQIRWFIRRRWVAGSGGILAFWVMSVLDIPIPALPLYVISGAVLVYNLFFQKYAQKLEGATPHKLSSFSRFANIQIVADWVALTLVVYYTGGIESPLVFFFIFHVIISTILLSQLASYLQATLAAFLITFLAVAEYYGVISHIHIPGILDGRLYNEPVRLFTFLLFFSSTLYISTYLASSVSKRLRVREEELVVLKKNLEEAYYKLEESDVAKSEFVMMVTHELRSPLSAVESILKLFSEGYAGDLLDEQKKLVYGIGQRTHFLIGLVNDLLHLAQVKAGKFQKKKEEVNLAEIIERVINSVQTRAKSKRLNLQVDLPDGPVMFWGNSDEIELLFSNLIGNSVKYTLVGGSILVRMVEENLQIKVEVSDTGIGIAAEDSSKIFEEFYRAENAKKIAKAGTGLGLSIVKRVVETYGGRIKVKSTPGRGTTFTFYLPKKNNSHDWVASKSAAGLASGESSQGEVDS
ncbi:HAMP domain-containing histidine kinase [Candidatus Aerophobetes bacterium]|nr:HAMP domain-containing histidine kinase [Candidatus Aerophobetes bacterium]